MEKMVKKEGYTLVEMIIVMAILAFMVMAVIGILNPVALVGRGSDAKRKSNLKAIKTAFEEYYNDRGCYPTGATLAAITANSACNTNAFSPWLNPWPCDPETRRPYLITVDSVACPHWFKVFTLLQSNKDPDIPVPWTETQYNYGVSSTNVNWFE